MVFVNKPAASLVTDRHENNIFVKEYYHFSEVLKKEKENRYFFTFLFILSIEVGQERIIIIIISNTGCKKR